jgi:C1A family cysteine protease
MPVGVAIKMIMPSRSSRLRPLLRGTGGRRYATGLRFDPWDPRDVLFVAPPRILPTRVDHREEVTPVRDQGNEGSCTGHAVVAAAELLYWRSMGRPPDLSERWAYEKAREHDEWPGTDYEGSSIRGAVKGWLKEGLCPEAEWAYVPGKPGMPSPRARNSAAEYPLLRYERCLGNDNLRHAIHHRGVVIVGASIHRGWLEAAGREDIPFSPGGEPVGGHAFVLVGYDDGRGIFWVKNSWGTGWGAGGFAAMSYQDALLNVRDAWTVTVPD